MPSPTAGDDGYQKLREHIFENQKRLDVIPADTQLELWPSDVLKPWDELTADEQKLFIKQVEVFAAYAAFTDHEIGHVIQAIDEMGKLDNTLVIYINADRGLRAFASLSMARSGSALVVYIPPISSHSAAQSSPLGRVPP